MLPDALSRIREATGQKFVVIIDEWDVLIRDEAADQKVQMDYINFLRGMFKGTEPTKYIQLAYLTGILPIKREKTESALNNFDEYTMLDAGNLAPYSGFTEKEVQELCKEYNRSYEQVKCWYDGYVLEDCHVYNPRAVVSMMTKGRFQSYWSGTGTYEAIVPLINMDFDGLKTALIEMLAGASVRVDVTSFQNLLDATLNMDAAAVAEGIEKIHTEYASAIQYNNENSLSSVPGIAYLSAIQYYFKPVRELPTGRGFADFVFIPKPEYSYNYPALVIELKWNRDARTAVNQIREK